jgi:ParB family chromosome partitioning protein
MKRKDALRKMMAPISVESRDDDEGEEKRPIKSRALKSMGLSLHDISAEASEADKLRSQLATGEHVVEIDPELVDPAFIRDRLTDHSDPDLEELKQSIATHGQQVPILVRPHPETSGRYQAAYGHRRLEALRLLKRSVRAVVRDLSDVELVVAQGKENLERRDLSFIERALFATRLEDRGFDRAALTAALSVHKGNLSTMIAVARSVPVSLIVAIGPAPRIGRPRWEQLADALRVSGADAKAMATIETGSFRSADTDTRFSLVFAALKQESRMPVSRTIEVEGGRALARVQHSGGRTKLTIDEAQTGAFGSYLVEQLPEIYAAFRRRAGV